MTGAINTALFPPLRPEWLVLVAEPAIDPVRRMIDSHHHLWGPLPSQYMAEELLNDANGVHNVVASVYVECKFHYRTDGPELLRPLGEIEFARRVAERAAEAGERFRPCARIVGCVDLLRLGSDAGPVLDEALEVGGGRLKGIRNISAWSADTKAAPPMPGRFDGHLLHDDFRRGFEHLAPFGLVFDAFLYHTQLADLVDLAKAFPETRIVLNHLGGPLGIGGTSSRARDIFCEWHQSILQIAQCPNVFLKLSGMGMRITGFDMDRRMTPPTSDDLAAAWHPVFSVAIEAVGAERCMFGSNFPVDKGGYSYASMWNAFEKIVADYPEAEKDRMFCGTAADVYKLDL